MDRLHIFKIGGNIVDNESRLHSFLKDFSSLNESKILIHGGGKEATSVSNKLGIPVKLNNGRRITDAATLDIITMVYAGKINKRIVSKGLLYDYWNTFENIKKKNYIVYGSGNLIKKL